MKLALWLSISAALPAQDVQVFEREERPLAALVLMLGAPGAEAKVDASSMLDLLAAQLEKNTRIEAITPERAGFDPDALRRCAPGELLTCWTGLLDGVRAPSGKRFRFLLVVSSLGGAGKVSLSSFFIDLERAESAIASAPSAELAEEAVAEGAALHESGSIALDDRASLESFAARAVAGKARTPELAPCAGIIALAHACADCWLSLDDTPLGAVHAGEVKVTGLCGGRRRIVLGSARDELACSVDVAEETIRRADLKACERRTAAAEVDDAPPLILWPALAIAGGGVVLSAIGVERALDDPARLCIGGECALLSEPSSRAQDELIAGRGRAPLTAIGVSLLAAGGVTAISSLIFDDEPWWIPAAAGLLAGGAAFGVGAWSGLH